MTFLSLRFPWQTLLRLLKLSTINWPAGPSTPCCTHDSSTPYRRRCWYWTTDFPSSVGLLADADADADLPPGEGRTWSRCHDDDCSQRRRDSEGRRLDRRPCCCRSSPEVSLVLAVKNEANKNRTWITKWTRIKKWTELIILEDASLIECKLFKTRLPRKPQYVLKSHTFWRSISLSPGVRVPTIHIAQYMLSEQAVPRTQICKENILYICTSLYSIYCSV